MADQSYEMLPFDQQRKWLDSRAESFKTLNPHLFGGVGGEKPQPRTGTTDEHKLNKTERAYLTHLRSQSKNGWVGIQCITLKIADDTRYTPDFWTFNYGQLTAYEVKGFFRDDAKVKIKVAARMFWWINFVLVRKNGSGWNYEDVKP